MYDINYLKNYAIKNKNGKCLSIEYTNNNGSYLWECSKGHQFKKVWLCVKTRKAWCLICERGTCIEFLQEYAEKYKGECLSIEYIDNKTNYKFKCENNHEFTRNFKSIRQINRQHYFCQYCKLNRDQLTIDILKKLAIDKGGECLSEKYIKVDTKYKWKCENNHIWEASWENIGYKNSTWCPKCITWSFEKFKEFAKTKKGECIECLDKKDFSQNKFIWKCEFDHTWISKGYNIVYNKSWCPHCQKLCLNDALIEATNRNGKCLSNNYINCAEHLLWECKYGHQFSLSLANVRNGNRWCKMCSDNSKRLDLSIAKEIAIKNGGEFLSTEYINLETPLLWRCKEGHEWTVALQSIKSLGQWCLKCHLRTRRINSLQLVYDYINIKNGKLLSEIDTNSDNTLVEQYVTIECNKKHTWNCTLASLLQKSWCPNCLFKSESKCRDILEEIYPYKFPKQRLKCMEYLELDGNCIELGIAYEYDGIQHSEYKPHFHRNGLIDLEKQQERDTRKDELCKMNGIYLIRIPHIYSYNKPQELKEYIYSELHKAGF